MTKYIISLLLGFLLNLILEPQTYINQCYVEKRGLYYFHRLTTINLIDGREIPVKGRDMVYHSWDDWIYRLVRGTRKCEE